MAYFVHFDEDSIGKLPLSDQAKKRVKDFVDYAIANVTDEFRLDIANRPVGGPYFERELILHDKEGDDFMHRVTFQVNDLRAPVGVLLVVDVKHHRGDKWRPPSSVRNGFGGGLLEN